MDYKFQKLRKLYNTIIESDRIKQQSIETKGGKDREQVRIER
jgi:hypothetical protein